MVSGGGRKGGRVREREVSGIRVTSMQCTRMAGVDGLGPGWRHVAVHHTASIHSMGAEWPCDGGARPLVSPPRHVHQ